MYLHLGQDYIVQSRDVIGIFDIETTTTGKRSREFLARAQKEGAAVSLSNDIPKSFVLTDFPEDTVFISPISSGTLAARMERFEPK